MVISCVGEISYIPGFCFGHHVTITSTIDIYEMSSNLTVLGGHL